MSRLTFTTDAARLQKRFADAVRDLAGNVRPVCGHRQPVLTEGGVYTGVWLECGPHEGLVYAAIDPQVARANHEFFFDLQRDDGALPCLAKDDEGVLFAWIQMAVPIARTAWQLARRLGDEAFLVRAYRACARWDDWLAAHRDTRGTGLCECFCEYDTGHDNSPRFLGRPKRGYRERNDLCDPTDPALPYLAPDLSATVYGGRRALAAMARALGDDAAAERWDARAEAIRGAIFEHCFDPRDGCFYDRLPDGRLLRIRGDAMLRVLMEHVPDRTLGEEILRRHVLDPRAFWAPYPLPSIAMDDPACDPDAEHNCWGGPSQALAALRTPLWFDHYGHPSEHRHLMQRWVSAVLAADRFGQQIHPVTGRMGYPDQYSPVMLVLIDFTMRLHGVYEEPERLVWTSGLPAGASRCTTTLATRGGTAEFRQERGRAGAWLAGRELFWLEGTARVVTGSRGEPLQLVGVAPGSETVTLRAAGQARRLALDPNQTVDL